MSMYMISIAFVCGIIGALTGAFQECLLAGIIMVFMTAFPQVSLLGDLVSYGFIPFVAFSGAVAATAYASKIRKHNFGGAAILTSLCKTADLSVLLVSGIFAVLGLAMATALGKIPITFDNGAVSVIISAVFVRIVFGDGKFLNPNLKTMPRYSTKKSEWFFWLGLGLVIGCGAGFIIDKTGNAFLPFYLSLASLLFWFLENDFPPSHHITCTAGYAMLATNSILAAAVWGAIACAMSTFIGDAINTDASTHIDPPATTIGILSIIIYIIYYVIL